MMTHTPKTPEEKQAKMEWLADFWTKCSMGWKAEISNYDIWEPMTGGPNLSSDMERWRVTEYPEIEPVDFSYLINKRLKK